MSKEVQHKIFHSKILLFGEHIINKGAMGLAAPVEIYNGLFRFGDVKDKKIRNSNESLELFANYIIHHDKIGSQYDTNRFLEDIENGLYFDSTIPQGYGLGSSGALVAAVYDQYHKFKKRNYTISGIKDDLAALEGYFHGKSSGLDGIVCYLNKAVLLSNSEVTKTFELVKPENPGLKLFLMNTRSPRNTSIYVKLFLEKCRDKKFMNLIETSLVPTTNIAIDSFIQRKYTALMNSMKLISQLQFDLLPEFIPSPFKDVWKNGLSSNQYHLKICGAGGGGFIIGVAKEDSKLDILLHGKDVVELMKF